MNIPTIDTNAIDAMTGGFAAIVGLIADFKTSSDASKARDFDVYLDWLRRHEHDQLVSLIQDNAAIGTAVRNIVTDQHGEVMSELNDINALLARLVANFNSFGPLAVAISGANDKSIGPSLEGTLRFVREKIQDCNRIFIRVSRHEVPITIQQAVELRDQTQAFLQAAVIEDETYRIVTTPSSSLALAEQSGNAQEFAGVISRQLQARFNSIEARDIRYGFNMSDWKAWKLSDRIAQ